MGQALLWQAKATQYERQLVNSKVELSAAQVELKKLEVCWCLHSPQLESH